MNRFSSFIIALVAMATLFSCSPKQPYTSYLAAKYKLTEADLKKIQFYTSEDIILSTKMSASKTETEKGDLVISSNTSEDQIIIKKGTPGILEKMSGTEKVYISFEVGEGKFLVFGSNGQREPFRLMADSWENGNGKLTYAGKTYYATGLSGKSYLLIRIKKSQKRKSSQTVVEGRKIQ
jgi:hypothetical protein